MLSNNKPYCHNQFRFYNPTRKPIDMQLVLSMGAHHFQRLGGWRCEIEMILLAGIRHRWIRNFGTGFATSLVLKTRWRSCGRYKFHGLQQNFHGQSIIKNGKLWNKKKFQKANSKACSSKKSFFFVYMVLCTHLKFCQSSVFDLWLRLKLIKTGFEYDAL